MEVIIASILAGAGYFISQNNPTQTTQNEKKNITTKSRNSEFKLVNANFQNAKNNKNNIIPRQYNQNILNKENKHNNYTSKLSGKNLTNFNHNNRTRFY